MFLVIVHEAIYIISEHVHSSHLKLILTILIVPIIFILLIATDAETKDFENEVELTTEEFLLDDNSFELSLPKEDEIVIKSGDTFYSTLMDYGINSSLINKIANDSELKDFIRLKVNDRIYMKVSDEQVEMKRFSGEDYFIDVLTIIENSYKFTRKRDELENLLNTENL